MKTFAPKTILVSPDNTPCGKVPKLQFMNRMLYASFPFHFSKSCPSYEGIKLLALLELS